SLRSRLLLCNNIEKVEMAARPLGNLWAQAADLDHGSRESLPSTFGDAMASAAPG
ncbi:hypothetical protein CRG98_038401, partial [Punica granatum]